jgi:hypothetical protein
MGSAITRIYCPFKRRSLPHDKIPFALKSRGYFQKSGSPALLWLLPLTRKVYSSFSSSSSSSFLFKPNEI